jgi:hypothetical protein
MGLFIAVVLLWFFVLTARDAVSLLTLAVAALFLLPANYTLQGLGSAGIPAVILGLGALAWWTAGKIIPTSGIDNGFQPVRLALIVFGCAILLGAAKAFSQHLSGADTRNVDRGLIDYAAYFGVALMAADGIHSRARLDALLQRLVLAGAFLAVIGMVQFGLGINPYGHLSLPGFRQSVLVDIGGFGTRGLFHRAFGSSEQPVEFGAVLTAILPLALHYAANAASRERLQRWLLALVIVFGIPLSVSRTGVIGSLAALMVFGVVWTWRQRLNALALAICFALAVRALVPGLVGTIASLFINFAQSNSVTGRTGRYDLVAQFFYNSPLLGYGFRRPNPDLPVVDNQYLTTLIQSGAIALVALIILLIVGMSVARGARRRARDSTSQSLGQALSAGIAVSVFTFLTYDALSFRMASITLFVLIGASGALWRLVQESPVIKPVASADHGMTEARIG